MSKPSQRKRFFTVFAVTLKFICWIFLAVVSGFFVVERAQHFKKILNAPLPNPILPGTAWIASGVYGSSESNFVSILRFDSFQSGVASNVPYSTSAPISELYSGPITVFTSSYQRAEFKLIYETKNLVCEWEFGRDRKGSYIAYSFDYETGSSIVYRIHKTGSHEAVSD